MKWTQSPPSLAFPHSPSSVYLFVGDKRWKEALGVLKNGRLEESRAFFYVLADLRQRLTWLRRTASTFWFLSFACLHFQPLFCFPSSPVSLSLPIIFSATYLLTLNYFFLCLFSRNFSFVDFSHCPLFLSPIVQLPLPHFYVSHAGCFSLPASTCLSPHMPCITEVFTLTKDSSPGLDASQVSPSLLLAPPEVSDSQVTKSLFLWKATGLLGRLQLWDWTLYFQG